MTEVTRCPHCHRRLPRAYHFVPPSYGPETAFGVIAFTAGYGACFYVLVHLGWPSRTMLFWPIPDYPAEVLKMVTGGLFFGIWLALLGLATVTFYYFEERAAGRDAENEDATVDASEFAPTGPYTLRRLPAGVSQLRLWQYLVAIAAGRVTLSQEGAARFGLDRDQSNAVKEWLLAVGWWEWINEANASGRWTDEGQRVLNRLSQPEPALWDELLDPPVNSDHHA